MCVWQFVNVYIPETKNAMQSMQGGKVARERKEKTSSYRSFKFLKGLGFNPKNSGETLTNFE